MSLPFEKLKSPAVVLALALALTVSPAEAQLPGMTYGNGQSSDDSIWEVGGTVLRQFEWRDGGAIIDRRASSTVFPNPDTSTGYLHQGALGLIATADATGRDDLFDCVETGDHYPSNTDDSIGDPLISCERVGWVWEDSDDGLGALFACAPSGEDRFATLETPGQEPGAPCEVSESQELGFVRLISSQEKGFEKGGPLERCAFTAYDEGGNHPGECNLHPGCLNDDDSDVCPTSFDPNEDYWKITNNASGDSPDGCCSTGLFQQPNPSSGFLVDWKHANPPYKVEIGINTVGVDMTESCVGVDGMSCDFCCDQNRNTPSIAEPYFAYLGFEDAVKELHPDPQVLGYELDMSVGHNIPNNGSDNRARVSVHWFGRWCNHNQRVSMHVFEKNIPETPVGDPDFYKVDVDGQGNRFVKMTGRPWGIWIEDKNVRETLVVDWYQIIDSLIDRGHLDDPESNTLTCLADPTPVNRSIAAGRLETYESEPDVGTVSAKFRAEDIHVWQRCYAESGC